MREVIKSNKNIELTQKLANIGLKTLRFEYMPSVVRTFLDAFSKGHDEMVDSILNKEKSALTVNEISHYLSVMESQLKDIRTMRSVLQEKENIQMDNVLKMREFCKSINDAIKNSETILIVRIVKYKSKTDCELHILKTTADKQYIIDEVSYPLHNGMTIERELEIIEKTQGTIDMITGKTAALSQALKGKYNIQ